MKEMKWNDRYNLGVEVIDKAHQKLFSIVGKLIELNEDPAKQQHACGEGIKYFKNYTVKHFSEEEAYMKSVNYSGFEMHKSLHDNLRDKILPSLQEELERENYSEDSVRHFLGICCGWLSEHIMIEDHAIVGRVANKWVYHPQEDAEASLEKAIIEMTMDMFRLEAGIVSEHYSGEDFSARNVLCYRLNYLSSEEKRSQVFLIYEEKLVLHMLSGMVGREIRRTDKMVVETMKLLSARFVERIGAHFTGREEYTLVKSDLLTFDQLLRSFEKEYPPYSLLFDVEGKGYLAFCVRQATVSRSIR